MKGDRGIHQRILHYAYLGVDVLYQDFGISGQGYNDRQVEESRQQYGSNILSGRASDTVLYRLRRAFINPFAIVLLVLASISFVTDVLLASNFSRNMTTVIIILPAMVESDVVCMGDHTLFGFMASAVAGEAVETSFTKGVNAVSWGLIRFMLIMVPLVFFINGITKGDWVDAFLFGISIAVGLTPEMLPMIVTTCLAKGAVSMSKKQTIVKNLNSIQNFEAMDILCTDKTGTLIQDKD